MTARARAIAAAVLAALAVWLTFGALAVTGPGPFTARVGVLPPWGVLAAILIVAVVISAAITRRAPERRITLTVLPLVSFLWLICLPWLPIPVPRAFLVWTGPVTVAVWAGLAASFTLARPWRWRTRLPALANPRRAPWIAAAAAAAFFGMIAAGAAPMVPAGDEPHYLIIAQSLFTDGDLRIENNHARRDYAPYFNGTLRPDYFVRGKDGEIYSIHAPGLPAIIAPVYAIGGYRAVVLFLLIIASAGVGLLWKMAYAASGDAGAAWFGTCAASCATPIAFHTFTVYPDTPAWVVALTGVLALMRLRTGGQGSEARLRDQSPRAASAGQAGGRTLGAGIWLLHGAALALLPWIHSRFAWLAACFGLFVLLRLPRTREGARAAGWFLAIPAVSAVAWFGFFYAIYGTPNPQAPYGTFARTQASRAFIPDGVLGVLFDQQFGLLVYAPVFLVALGGWVAAVRGDSANRRLAIELAVLTLPYLASVTYIRMWWGGWSVPVRFSVPVLTLGGIFAAVAWRRMTERGTRAASLAALLVTLFTTVSLAIVQRGRLAYNTRDGVSLWLEWLSPLADLPRGFPSFFRGPGSTLILHSAVWIAALGLAWLALRRLARRGLRGRATLASATAVAFALAAMAALTIVWRADGAAGVTAAPAQLALLRGAAVGRPVGVRLNPPGLTTSRAVVSALRIRSPDRALAGSRERPVFAVPGWIPAGRYDLLGPRADPLRLRILRGDEPILTLLPHETTIRLPVDVPALIGHGSSAQDTASDRLVLQPAEVGPIFDDAPRARRARRYGPAVVYFLDDDAFAEPDAFWIRGGAAADIVVQFDGGGGEASVLVRNAPVENSLLVSSGGWRDERKLAPGEERALTIPLDTSHGATRLRWQSASGFRPSAFDRRSADSRYLGIWVQFR
jgi:hypothetical protein